MNNDPFIVTCKECGHKNELDTSGVYNRFGCTCVSCGSRLEKRAFDKPKTKRKTPKRPEGLTDRELAVSEHAKKLGWEVYRNGWPDFLLVDPNSNNAIFLEVKAQKDKLRTCQKKMHKVLKKLGIDVEVLRLSKRTSKYEKNIKSCIPDLTTE